MQPIQIHYDCDPGQDDAIALLYALGSDKIDVKSISVVGGNIDVKQCARNALQLLELSGRVDIPVYIGADDPLVREANPLPEIFGVTGMAGAEDLPQPTIKAQNIDWDKGGLSHLIKANNIVATGPLTNLVLEIQRNSAFVNNFENLFLMGGCPYPEPLRGEMGNYQAPNTNGKAEYNFAIDPEAAKMVFRAGFKNIVLIGLNITKAVLYNSEVDKALRAINSKVAIKSADILATVGKGDIRDYGYLRKTPNDPVRAMHDVIAMAAVDAPEIFEFVELPLRIVAEAKPAPAGQSLIDADNYDYPNVKVAKAIDNKKFLEKLVENIEKV